MVETNNNLTKCTSCGTEIAKSAKTCPNCGAKVKKPIYKKWWFWLIIVILAVIVIASMGSDDSTSTSSDTVQQEVQDNSASQSKPQQEANQSEPQKEVTTESPAISVSAADLLAAYEANEVSADKQYKDKKLSVTGVVDNISVVLDQTSVVLTSGDAYELLGVRCYFKDEAEIEKVSNLSKGTTITVEGVCSGYGIEPIIQNCVIK